MCLSIDIFNKFDFRVYDTKIEGNTSTHEITNTACVSVSNYSLYSDLVMVSPLLLMMGLVNMGRLVAGDMCQEFRKEVVMW